MSKEIFPKEHKPEIEKGELMNRFEHDIRGQLGKLVLAFDLQERFAKDPSRKQDAEKNVALTRAAWEKLFSVAERFQRGDFGMLDESLRADIGKVLALRERDLLDKELLSDLPDSFKEMLPKNEEE